jgi:hypothetical protein
MPCGQHSTAQHASMAVSTAYAWHTLQHSPVPPPAQSNSDRQNHRLKKVTNQSPAHSRFDHRCGRVLMDMSHLSDVTHAESRRTCRTMIQLLGTLSVLHILRHVIDSLYSSPAANWLSRAFSNPAGNVTNADDTYQGRCMAASPFSLLLHLL